MTSQATSRIKATLATNIRLARDAEKLKQRELAALVGVDPMAVSRWERASASPSDANLIKLAAVLKRDVAWFYTDQSTEAAA